MPLRAVCDEIVSFSRLSLENAFFLSTRVEYYELLSQELSGEFFLCFPPSVFFLPCECCLLFFRCVLVGFFLWSLPCVSSPTVPASFGFWFLLRVFSSVFLSVRWQLFQSFLCSGLFQKLHRPRSSGFARYQFQDLFFRTRQSYTLRVEMPLPRSSFS